MGLVASMRIAAVGRFRESKTFDALQTIQPCKPMEFAAYKYRRIPEVRRGRRRIIFGGKIGSRPERLVPNEK